MRESNDWIIPIPKYIKILILILSYLLRFYLKIVDKNIPDISSHYPRISHDSNYYIPVICTADFHGYYYPKQMSYKNISYTQGGLDYLAKYISIIKNEFNNNILYLDGGDNFQGGIESEITDGEIISEFFNIMGLNASILGNHEFDYSIEDLKRKLSRTNFPYIVSNLYDNNKKTKNIFDGKIITSKIFEMPINNEKKLLNNNENNIKIGVIGLTMSIEKSELSNRGYNLEFLDYKKELIENANYLKEKKANAIILLAHIPLVSEKYIYKLTNVKLRTKNNYHPLKSPFTSDLYNLINSIDNKLIDAVIASHHHGSIITWINDIPVLESNSWTDSLNVLYLPFNKKNKTLIRNEIKIEGPLPVCKKVFSDSENCDRPKADTNSLNLVNFKFHGIKITKEKKLRKISKKYFKLFKELNKPLFKLICNDSGIIRDNSGNSILGNIATDIARNVTKSDVAILNFGYFRDRWYPGIITEAQFNNMIAFKNNLCTFEMNGKELVKMIEILQNGDKKYYANSGIYHEIYGNKNENNTKILKIISKGEYVEIEERKIYKIATIDLLIEQGGDDFNKINSWYKKKNLDCSYGGFNLVVKENLRNKTIDVKDYEKPRLKVINKL